MPDASPSIGRAEWGLIEVGGATYKDVKLWPGGARSWDWRETGTSHAGVSLADVDEVVGHGARVVILSTGRGGRLTVSAETEDAIRDRGVTVEVLGTEEAIRRYNELADEGVAVGALIHTTC